MNHTYNNFRKRIGHMTDKELDEELADLNKELVRLTIEYKSKTKGYINMHGKKAAGNFKRTRHMIAMIMQKKG